MGELIDHLAWLFRPGRFLFGADSRRTLRVPGWETLVFIHHPAQVRDVMRATHDRPDTVFLGGAGNAFLEPLFGEQSVFLLDGDRHRTARSIVGPTLNAKAVQRWTGVIDRIADEELAIARRTRRIDLGTWCRHLTMRVMCRAVLNVTDPARTTRIFRRFEATTGYLANLVAYKKGCWRPRGTMSPRRALEFLVRRVVESRVRRVDAELYPLIAARRRLIETRSARPDGPWTPLDALITAQAHHSYDDAFIRDNLVALLAAGYDTTGAALAWLFFWLSSESTTATDLRNACLRGDGRRLKAFRDEVLRICPPVDILPRRIAVGKHEEAQRLIDASGEIATGNGSDTPLVCPFVHKAHHDPDVYQSPDVFDPERFLQRSYRPDEFFPYGLGTRMCIGRSLGELVLERVLQRVLINGAGPRVPKPRFCPVRRNVSIWPGFALHAVIARVTRCSEEEVS